MGEIEIIVILLHSGDICFGLGPMVFSFHTEGIFHIKNFLVLFFFSYSLNFFFIAHLNHIEREIYSWHLPTISNTYLLCLSIFSIYTPLLDYVSLFDYLVLTLTNTLFLCYCRLWLLSKWHLKCEFAIGLNPSRALLVLSQSF